MLVTIADRPVHVNDEGFLENADEWTEEIGAELAADLGIELGEEHLAVIRFVREDYASNGVTPTLRRTTTQTGVPLKRMFALFPKKPAKKLAYVAGVPKPVGCV
jgi:tRNA 2-thiouridine synthesizing protein E